MNEPVKTGNEWCIITRRTLIYLERGGFPTEHTWNGTGVWYWRSPWEGVPTADYLQYGAIMVTREALGDEKSWKYEDLLLAIFRRGPEALREAIEAEQVLRGLGAS